MPTVDIPDKICKHCGGTKWYTHNGRYWCYSRRDDSNKTLFKQRDKKQYNERRRATNSYKEILLQKKKKRKEYRELHPIIRPPRLTQAERSAKYYAKKKDDPLYKEKNCKRVESWLLVNKEKLMTSDRYAKRQLGETTTLEQRERYIIYLKCLRQLKQIENEKETSN
jgi:hypothetical protein